MGNRLDRLRIKEQKILAELKELHEKRARGEKVRPHGKFSSVLMRLEMVRYEIDKLTKED